MQLANIKYIFSLQTKEENGKYYFHCQHGEEECFGNKVHACAIELIGNMTEYVQFTDCLFSVFEVEAALKKVSPEYFIVQMTLLSQKLACKR